MKFKEGNMQEEEEENPIYPSNNSNTLFSEFRNRVGGGEDSRVIGRRRRSCCLIVVVVTFWWNVIPAGYLKIKDSPQAIPTAETLTQLTLSLSLPLHSAQCNKNFFLKAQVSSSGLHSALALCLVAFKSLPFPSSSSLALGARNNRMGIL